MLGLPSFFPPTEIHEFEYIPRFYDPRKEEMEYRIAKARKELGKEDAKDVRILRKGTFTSRMEYKHKEVRNSNLRVLIIFGVLCAAMYMYFFN